MRDKRRPTGFATFFFPLLTLSKKEKKLSMKAMTTYKRPAIIGQKLKLQTPCFKKHEKANQKCVRALHEMCTLWLLWKTQQIHGTTSFTNNDKKLNIPAEPNFDMCTYVQTCVMCRQQFVGQTWNKFSTRWSSHWTNCNKPNHKEGKVQMALSRVYSVFRGIVNNRTYAWSLAISSHYYFCRTTQFSLSEYLWTHGITNVTHKLIFKAWFLHRVKQFCNTFALSVELFDLLHHPVC